MGSIRNFNLPIFSILIVPLLVFVSGCEVAKKGLSLLQKPSASVTNSRLKDFSFREATLEFDVEISNPYGVSLPVGNLRYSLSRQGNELFSGTVKPNGSVPSRGKKVISFPARITYEKVLNAIKDVRPGQVIPYRVDLTLFTEVPGGRTIELPMSHQGDFPIPAVPKFEIESVKWKSIGLTGARGELSLNVRNTHEFPVELRDMNYTLKFGGQNVVESSITSSTRFNADESKLLNIPVSISGSKLGTGLLSMLSDDSVTYGLSGEVDLGTGYGNLTIPYDTSGRTNFLSN